MNKNLRGLLVAGAAGATLLGGYITISRLRKGKGSPVETEVVRQDRPVAPPVPPTEIVREDSTEGM